MLCYHESIASRLALVPGDMMDPDKPVPTVSTLPRRCKKLKEGICDHTDGHRRWRRRWGTFGCGQEMVGRKELPGTYSICLTTMPCMYVSQSYGKDSYMILTPSQSNQTQAAIFVRGNREARRGGRKRVLLYAYIIIHDVLRGLGARHPRSQLLPDLPAGTRILFPLSSCSCMRQICERAIGTQLSTITIRTRLFA